MSTLLEPIDFALSYYAKTKKVETPEERKALLERFLPYLQAKPAGIEYEDMLVKIANATSFQPEAIREIAKKSGKPEQGRTKPDFGAFEPIRRRNEPQTMFTKLYNAERMLLYYMMSEPEAVDVFQRTIGSFRHSTYEEAANYIIEYEREIEGSAIDLSKFLAFIENYGGDGGKEVQALLSDLAFEKNYPRYDKDTLRQCLDTIVKEGKMASEKLAVKKEIESGTLDSGAQANKELAERIAQMWKKKG